MLVIANWKMHGSQKFIEDWLKTSSDILNQKNDLAGLNSLQVGIAPPFPYLALVHNNRLSDWWLGAQDISEHNVEGAHTGHVTSSMLKDVGCNFVIIGHSEVRKAGETSSQRLDKLKSAVSAQLLPIFCIGESLAQRQSGESWSFVKAQLNELKQLELNELVLAYEPIWAIGTGVQAKPEDVATMHDNIRVWLSENLPHLAGANQPGILYGGSVKPNNAQVLCALAEVSGVLVGGASLKPTDFMAIVHAAARSID